MFALRCAKGSRKRITLILIHFYDLHSAFKVGVQLLEDEENHDTFIENHETICEPEEETTATSLEESTALLKMGGEDT